MKSFDSKILFIKLIIIFSILLNIQSLKAIELDKRFVQKIDESFFEVIKNNSHLPRAIFLKDFQGKEIILYCFYSRENEKYILRTKLGEEGDNLLRKEIFTFPCKAFLTYKKNNEVFYEKGRTLKRRIFKDDLYFDFQYVPYTINGETNNCFICDLGYLNFRVSSRYLKNRSDLQRILFSVFKREKIIIRKSVRLNRYYYKKKNYMGYVQRFDGRDLIKDKLELLLYPIHKFTAYKHLTDRKFKEEKDRTKTIEFLDPDNSILSQDERVKRIMVPAWVKLNMKKIDNTDIGSGQNNFIFLSIGPGINYFDDRWRAERKNIPSPRFIYDKNICFEEKNQFYPSYSIDSGVFGDRRLEEINKFQVKDYSAIKFRRKILWMSVKRRLKYLVQLENRIFEYGIINDSDEIEKGFRFREKNYRGNIINNEIRKNDSSSITEETIGVIVPGNKEQYVKDYEQKMRVDDYSEYICGVHYKDYFINSVEETDLGMRMAYLEFILKRTHPQYYRILKSNKNKRAYRNLMRFINNIIRKNGDAFFRNSQVLNNLKKWEHKQEKWYEYLESCRDANEKMKKIKFNEFKKMLRKLEL